jgi:uncharacterized protein
LTTKVDQFPSLSALLREALGDVLSPGGDSFLDLMTDDISFEFPFPLPDGIGKIEGKQALADYLPKVSTLFTVESMTLDRAILSADGKAAVLEFTSRARANGSDRRYDQTYVSVIDIRDGLISRYRDYWNPLIVLFAMDGAETVNSVLRGDLRRP